MIPVSIFYRFALASFVIFVMLLLNRTLQRLNRRGHFMCMGQRLCLFCLNFLCFYTATQWIPSDLMSVVFSAATLWNALNACLWFGARVAPRVMVAGIIGLGGLVLLFWPELASHGASRDTLLGLSFALLGTFCFSTGNMLSSLQQRAGIRPLTGNVYNILYSASFLLFECLVFGVLFTFDASPTYVGALLYLAIPGSVIGFTAYLTLVGRMGPARAAYCTVLFPVVALNFDVRRRLSMDALGGIGTGLRGLAIYWYSRSGRPSGVQAKRKRGVDIPGRGNEAITIQTDLFVKRDRWAVASPSAAFGLESLYRLYAQSPALNPIFTPLVLA